MRSPASLVRPDMGSYDALLYPLEETLVGPDAASILAGGFVEVASAVLDAHWSGELPDPCPHPAGGNDDGEQFGAAWADWVRRLGARLGRKGKALFMPLRVAMTGRHSGPDIPAQLRLLGLAVRSTTAKADRPAAARVRLQAAALPARMAALERAVGELRK